MCADPCRLVRDNPYTNFPETGRNVFHLTRTRFFLACRDPTPIMTAAPREKNATWFEPQLAAQIAYQEWTTDQKLQQPAFPGRRKAAGNDKFRQEFELVAQLGVERTATLVRRESTMTVGRHIQCVPAGQDRARPFALIQPQQATAQNLASQEFSTYPPGNKSRLFSSPWTNR